jgi:hypothetical protein
LVTQISDLLAQITGEPPSARPALNNIQKRKADGELQRAEAKHIKTESQRPPVIRPAVPNKTATIAASIRPGTHSNATTGTKATANAQISNASTAKIGSVSEPTKPLKKGSYAEILARAKAAQAAAAQVGKIQHKPIERRLGKKERRELAEQERVQRASSKGTSSRGKIDSKSPGTSGKVGTNGGRGGSTTRLPPVQEKKPKKAALATTGYKGTARPIPMASKVSSKASTIRSNGPSHATPSRRPQHESEDEEDDGEEQEEEDYYSDESDMEAAVFEVDEEEERAARIARKEDEEAAKEEARLRAEKQRRLAALVRGRH